MRRQRSDRNSIEDCKAVATKLGWTLVSADYAGNILYSNQWCKQCSRKNDSPLQRRLRHRLRSRLSNCLKGRQRTGSAVRDLGCTIEELRTYIKALWEPGMSWENWGNRPGTWQIDHRKALCRFDLSKREETLEACHFLNLQPLWHHDHTEKTIEDLRV